jgi:uncharacterized protein (TIGR02596 family)
MRSWKPTNGFTLIELLAVLAVMGIVAAFAIPSLVGALKGNHLSQSEQYVEGVLELARRTAITKNHAVEVRLYRYPGTGAFSSHNSFRALQAFEMPTTASFVAAEKIQPLPEGMILDSNAALSSVLDSSKRTISTGINSIPVAGTSYTYMTIHYFPDGSTDLSPTGGPWFMTLHDETKGDGLSTPPSNFITVGIDSINGTVTYYRP